MEAKSNASQAFSNGDFASALEEYTKALRLQPTSALTFSKRAECFVKLKRNKAAKQDCEQALKINPDSAKAMKVLGTAQRYLGEYEEACKNLGQGLAIDFDEESAKVEKEAEKFFHEIRVAKSKEKAKREQEEKKKMEERRKEAEEAMKNANMGGGNGGTPGGNPGGFPGSLPAWNGRFDERPGSDGSDDESKSDERVATSAIEPGRVDSRHERPGSWSSAAKNRRQDGRKHGRRRRRRRRARFRELFGRPRRRRLRRRTTTDE